MTWQRPSWDETWLAVARTVAQRSLCSREPAGAVVVCPDNEYMLAAFSGPPEGYIHGSQPCSIWCKRHAALTQAPDYSSCHILHAEANALVRSDYTRRYGGTLYTTEHPCLECAKLIANSGLSRVVTDAPINPEAEVSYLFLRQCGVRSYQIE